MNIVFKRRLEKINQKYQKEEEDVFNILQNGSMASSFNGESKANGHHALSDTNDAS